MFKFQKLIMFYKQLLVSSETFLGLICPTLYITLKRVIPLTFLFADDGRATCWDG